MTKIDQLISRYVEIVIILITLLNEILTFFSPTQIAVQLRASYEVHAAIEAVENDVSDSSSSSESPPVTPDSVLKSHDVFLSDSDFDSDSDDDVGQGHQITFVDVNFLVNDAFIDTFTFLCL